MKSKKPLAHSMFLNKQDNLEHFEKNLILSLEIQLKVSELLRGGGVQKPLDNVRSFALFIKPSFCNPEGLLPGKF